MRIGIIGGGASGLVAAINAKSENNEVVILERNSECGKKILATGNGRCNYWNQDQSLKHYESQSDYLISRIINAETEAEVMTFFNELGVIPKIKNGYFYPNSNQALSIRNILVDECQNKNIIIKTNYLVENINRKVDIFVINNELEFDKLIISTGSFASPKTGSDGMGYKFLKEMGHTIIKPLPSLVQLNTINYPFLSKWKGIRSDVRLTLIENGKPIKEQFGEIQLTDYGISGICVFNLSNEVARGLDNNKKEIISINFLPDIKELDLIKMLSKDKSLKRVLGGLLNDKLIYILLDYIKIDESKKYTELSEKEKEKLLNALYKFQVEIKSTKSFNEAQVSSGGVKLDEINLTYMESKIIKDLFITGEIIDLTGECGGYNLGISWRTGIVAGKAARGDFDD